MFRWLMWYFVESVKCEHIPGPWEMRDLGMRKVQYCKKCKRCLKLI